MITVQLLEGPDEIQASDWVRQLSLIFTGQSDYLATENTYSGRAMNRLGWMRAGYVCPAWIGKTVADFNKAMNPKHRHAVETSAYEFIRGEIPAQHRERI